jgi:photosystem II stability/assembly factor-like uncharacterized protein
MSAIGSPGLLVGTTQGLVEDDARQRRHLDGHEITALAADGHQQWALVDGRTIWRARPDGVWEEVVALDRGEGTCLALTAAGLLVGTAGAHLLRLEDGHLVRIEPFDHVEGRRAWHTPWGDPPDTRSIAVPPTGALYVNVHVGGVVRSTDGGRSWRPTLDIDADVHQVFVHPERPGTVLAAAAIGLGLSEDGGETWRFDTTGLHARYLRAVTVAGDTVLVSASTGPGGRRAALYRKGLGSTAPFERCREGLPEWFRRNIDTACLAAAGSHVVFGTEEGRLFHSRDAGVTWEAAGTDLPPVRCVSLS